MVDLCLTCLLCDSFMVIVEKEASSTRQFILSLLSEGDWINPFLQVSFSVQLQGIITYHELDN